MKERGVEERSDYRQQLYKIMESMDRYFSIDFEILKRLEKEILTDLARV